MKIMLHGATNMSNYGDFLFAEFFYHKLKKDGHDVEFYAHPRYGISDYFARYLKVTPDRQNYWERVKQSDCLVFISGGYFVEPRKPGLIAEVKHYERYMKPATYFLRHNKPIYVLGVGAGPFSNKLFSLQARKVLNHATVVTVRDEESKRYCNAFGVQNDVIITSDTALLIGEFLKTIKSNTPRFELDEGRKMLLLHLDSNSEVKAKIQEVIVPAIRCFLDYNKDYSLYIAADGVKENALYAEYQKMLSDYQPKILVYDDPWVLTRQIERADLIVTTKLHMGIVGSALGSSVVSFPFVPQKTKRFYKQIGEPDRCSPLTDINQDMVLEMLEKYKDSRIQLPEELIAKARMNLELLPRN